MDPQQELFTEIRERLVEKGYMVFDAELPADDTPYPFIHMGESTTTDDANKTAVFGDVSQVIHVWQDNPRKRGTLSVIMLDVKNTCRAISHTENFAWRITDLESTVLKDDSTGGTLLHGVITVGFKFS